MRTFPAIVEQDSAANLFVLVGNFEALEFQIILRMEDDEKP